MVKSRNKPRRRLSIESLEKRQVMTATINEILVDPLFGSQDTDQYFELRGEPNETLDPGTYLLVVNDRDSVIVGPGQVEAIFDLSGQQFGSNGFLVLQQFNSPHSLSGGLVVGGPAPTVLTSATTGWSGLPGDIFTSLDGRGRIENILGSSTYFLIQSDVAPNLGDDIDANDDGVIDPTGPAQTWDVLDSISLHHGTFQGPVAYGQIVFVEQLGTTNPVVIAPSGAELIYTPGYGYAGRIGDSTGHTADDWVVGTVLEDSVGVVQGRFRLENGIFGTPLPRPFTGRDLDHLGESNFVGGVRGTVSEVIVTPAGEIELVPLPGVGFLADSNGNGVRDVLTSSVDPDVFAVGTELTNLYPGITLTTVGTDNGVFGFNVQPALQSFANTNGNRVFSHAGVNFNNDNRRLRIDFYRPARSVSIDVLAGLSISIPTYGRLEAFNAEGVSLGFVRSRALFGTASQNLRLNFSDDVIAYALAYSDDTFLNSSPFGQFDNLGYRQSAAIAVTDANGEYELEALLPGDYNIIPLTDTGIVFTTPLPSTPFSITRYENTDISFVVTQNSPPAIDPVEFTINENALVGSLIGTVIAADDDQQPVNFSIQDAVNSPVSIDPLTGELFVADASAFDFETTDTITVTVVATDSVGGFSTRPIDIRITDLNESPQVSVGQYSVSEEADQNSAFGRLDAFDPEFPDVRPEFAIIGGTGASVFSIDPTSGVLRVKDASLLNFEQTNSLTLQVAVTDHSLPPLTTTVTFAISVLDANDPPLITSDAFSVAEDATDASTVGTIEFTDVDLGQTQTFRLQNAEDVPFRIEPSTGTIFVFGSLDFETTKSYQLEVQIVDNGTPPRGSSKSIRINVLNADEPAQLTQTAFNVAENSASGVLIGTLIAIDPEGLTGLRFASLDSTNPALLFGGQVRLDSSNGRLTVAPGAVLDAEANPVLRDRVQILKGTTVVGNADVTLTLGNVNERPIIAAQSFGLPSGLPSGRAFAVVEVSDPDGDDITLEVTGTSAALFGIDAQNRLFVKAGVTIDFVANPNGVPVEITATDPAGLSATSISTVVDAPLPRFNTPIANQTVVSGTRVDFSFPANFRSENVMGLEVLGADGGSLPAGLRFDATLARISGNPVPTSDGTYTIIVRVLELDGDVEILKEESFTLTVNRSNRPLFNTISSLDVDGNGEVEPVDALRIINILARNRGSDAFALADISAFFVDTNGDNLVNARDALLVINFITRRLRNGNPESESVGLLAGGLDAQNKASDAAITELLEESSIF